MNERVDIPLMLRVLQREAQSLSGGNHEISFRVNEQLNVFGNEDQLRSAVSNLVYNAVNHTPKGTHIEVSWQQTAHGAQFQVSDNGPGIAAEHLPRLTERFTASTRPVRAKPVAAGWGWRSSNTRSAITTRAAGDPQRAGDRHALYLYLTQPVDCSRRFIRECGEKLTRDTGMTRITRGLLLCLALLAGRGALAQPKACWRATCPASVPTLWRI